MNLRLIAACLAAFTLTGIVPRAVAEDAPPPPPPPPIVFVADYTAWPGAMMAAVEAWNRNGIVEVRQVTSCAQVYDRAVPCVSVVMPELIEWRGMDTILGITTRQGAMHYEVEVSRVLLVAFSGRDWRLRNYYARSVLCHELGHALFDVAGADLSAHKTTGCMREGLPDGSRSYAWVTAPVMSELRKELAS